MPQRLTTSFINTNRPGSYFDVQVRSTPVGTSTSGNIVIIGEATGGARYTDIDLRNNFFTPDQLDRVQDIYISGPIVDAFRALATPSADANITGSANRIFIVKTNNSTQAQAVLSSNYGTLTDRNFGLDGNRLNYQITEVEAEQAPSLSGDTITDFSLLAGVQFGFRGNGGQAVLVDVFTGPATDYDTAEKVADLIAAALPATFTAAEGDSANTIRIFSEEDLLANQKGWGKSFELVDVNVGDLSALGLDAGITVSSQEPRVQIDIQRTETNTNEAFQAEAEIALEIGYNGTTATVTIDSETLTTSVVGGSGTNLSIKLEDFTTVANLASFIDSQDGYTATAGISSVSSQTSVLDQVSSVGIAASSDIAAGRISRASANFAAQTNQSAVVQFAATANAGLPDDITSAIFLQGGARGATLAADIADATIAIESIDVNFVVPLFSRDAAADIQDGLTDSASTYSISATNILVRNHVLRMSTARIRKHRTAFVSFWGTFSEAQQESSRMANARVSLSIQRTSQVNPVGEIVSHLPWHTASVAAGMQAAGFYRAIVNRFANVISFEDPQGFDSGSPGDIELALDSGLLFLEQAVAGNRWVSDQTTYVFDQNFVFTSIQAVYAVDLVSLNLSRSFQNAFTGMSLADVDASTALSFLASLMDAFKRQRLITSSDDAPLGFRNAKVEIDGPILSINVEIKPSTAIYFIPITIEVSQVTNSAS